MFLPDTHMVYNIWRPRDLLVGKRVVVVPFNLPPELSENGVI